MESHDCRTAIHTLMLDINSKYTRLTDVRLASLGVTPSQAAVLLYLEEFGNSKISSIASYLGMAESNVSNICSRLERAGYITRSRHRDDRRIVLVTLTRTAAPKIADIKAKADFFAQKMKSLMEEDDMDVIVTGLSRLNGMLDALWALLSESGDAAGPDIKK